MRIGSGRSRCRTPFGCGRQRRLRCGWLRRLGTLSRDRCCSGRSQRRVRGWATGTSDTQTVVGRPPPVPTGAGLGLRRWRLMTENPRDQVGDVPRRRGGGDPRPARRQNVSRSCPGLRSTLGGETAAGREALRACAELGRALMGARDTGEALDAVIAGGPWMGGSRRPCRQRGRARRARPCRVR